MNYARECEDWMDCGGLPSYILHFKNGVVRNIASPMPKGILLQRVL